MKKFIILITIIFSTFHVFASEKYEKGKILKILGKVDVSEEESESVKYKLRTVVYIKSGNLKGKKIFINHSYSVEDAYNLYYKEGDMVLLLIEEENGIYDYTIVDIDKRGKLLSIFVILFVLVIILGKWKGVKAILALLSVILLVIYAFIPLISKGYSPILISILLSAVGSFITVICIAGISKKGITAFLGTVAGVAVSGILSMFYIKTMRLSGYSTLEILYAADLLSGVKIKELISAGVIIGSLGAVMDVAMSISSSMEEIKKNSCDLDEKKLFKSGINIGKDIIGTMVNTLILAYLGSSMATILLFSMQGSDFPLIRILNFEFIATEILRAVCGSIGILVSVPITSLIGAKIYNKDVGVNEK